MLVVVLNHNLPDLANNCYEQLKRSIGKNELWVVDNGSDQAELPYSTTHQLPIGPPTGG